MRNIGEPELKLIDTTEKSDPVESELRLGGSYTLPRGHAHARRVAHPDRRAGVLRAEEHAESRHARSGSTTRSRSGPASIATGSRRGWASRAKNLEIDVALLSERRIGSLYRLSAMLPVVGGPAHVAHRVALLTARCRDPGVLIASASGGERRAPSRALEGYSSFMTELRIERRRRPELAVLESRVRGRAPAEDEPVEEHRQLPQVDGRVQPLGREPEQGHEVLLQRGARAASAAERVEAYLFGGQNRFWLNEPLLEIVNQDVVKQDNYGPRAQGVRRRLLERLRRLRARRS